MKITALTLGCKVNQYETRAMEQLLRARGHTIVNASEEADVYILNTCSVTAASDRKSRQLIRRVKREHPGALVAVCGCFAQTRPEDARAVGADLIAGTGERTRFVALLEEAFQRRAEHGAEDVRVELDDPASRRVFEPLPAGGQSPEGARTRAFLKVQDGCDAFCSYCVIPYARGPVRSEAAEDAVRQAKELASAGTREIVLTGIELSEWGRDLPGTPVLADLVEAVCTALPDTRIRLGSLEPRTVTEDFCARVRALPNLCPQFHLALQSGCDATLRRMRRRYDTARFLTSVTLLRETFSRPAMTTDLITGFPEETEAEFQQTLAFLRTCAFARAHIFPYSERPGTPAADLPQIPPAVREERAKRAAEVVRETRRDYLAACVGACYPVLFERFREGRWLGHAPNYMEVCVTDAGEESNLRNQIRPVRILSADETFLYGALEHTEGNPL